MLYRVNFCATPTDPLPPVDTLAMVEAADPLSAIEAMLKAGRVPQTGLMRWARVVLSGDGETLKVLRIPITPDGQIPLDWSDGDDPLFQRA